MHPAGGEGDPAVDSETPVEFFGGRSVPLVQKLTRNPREVIVLRKSAPAASPESVFTVRVLKFVKVVSPLASLYFS